MRYTFFVSLPLLFCCCCWFRLWLSGLNTFSQCYCLCLCLVHSFHLHSFPFLSDCLLLSMSHSSSWFAPFYVFCTYNSYIFLSVFRHPFCFIYEIETAGIYCWKTFYTKIIHSLSLPLSLFPIIQWWCICTLFLLIEARNVAIKKCNQPQWIEMSVLHCCCCCSSFQITNLSFVLYNFEKFFSYVNAHKHAHAKTMAVSLGNVSIYRNYRLKLVRWSCWWSVRATYAPLFSRTSTWSRKKSNEMKCWKN